MSKWIRIRKPTRSITNSNQVGLNYFYKFQFELIFDLVHQELGSLGLNT